LIQSLCRVESVQEVAQNIFVLTFLSPEISHTIQPGQFTSIRTEVGTDPLLRRPFSVYRTDGDRAEIVFNVIGKGTAALQRKRPGTWIDVIGPLGRPFSIQSDDFDTAVLVGGGLGVAPLPISTDALVRLHKRIVTFLGARSASQLVERHLSNLRVATDDGSKGYHGTVVDLMRTSILDGSSTRPKLFACGPTPMLSAVASFARDAGIPCEVSLEGPMGCGFGICQGCPVELADAERKYALMCKDGPTFDIQKIVI